ncbi:MBL fold metallo-hydrolase [Alloiococcus sp. CFN-8]|uniref:MBL fold metallo-hydrolase n=1 Tax=Alloiococcus sp. CFN-8 TaxID=3416081 RepID=UPI003CEFBEFC
MKTTYLNHCGFSVELQEMTLIFDYYKGNIPELPIDKPLYIFVSHGHKDHFNSEIFSLSHKYSNITYVLSNDITFDTLEELVPDLALLLKDKIHFIGTNENLTLLQEDFAITIETLKSTDAGVAFLITTPDQTIYHAGDLNLWSWSDEPEDENLQMEIAFKEEINKIQGRHINLAFMTLDPRQEERYSLGFDYFMRTVTVDKVYPIHCWEDYEIIDKLLKDPISEDYRDQIVKYR